MTALPRYKLRVGDQLTYGTPGEPDSAVPANGGGGGSRCRIDWDFHVVARHGTSSWRLVFSESRTREYESASGERTIRTLDSDGYFVIAEDGNFVENWTITPLANPTVIFPRLPSDRSQTALGWQSMLRVDGAHSHYKPAESGKEQGRSVWQFVEECQTELDPILRVCRQRGYDFDLERGLVTQVSTSLERGWPADSGPIISSDTIQLIGVAHGAGMGSPRIREDADRYFASCAEYQRLIDLALWELPEASRRLEDAAHALEQFDATSSAEFLREMLDRKLELHRRECGSLLSDAEKLAGLIDRPAPHWQSADLDGGIHALKDYAGQALVLCFWNRGCTWSIRALLALNALAGELRGQPIAFLGVNADRNLEDATFVWRTLKMVFPTVMDGPCEESLSRSYGADGYPTTVVIDPSGIIRRMRAGYSYRLASLVARELARLVGGATCASRD